ncbi:MAG: rhodanese-like domain-containing protein [Candidatus Krumholzibacteria bacterium]|nr:rhodanese-like domain-containing protein [Candidatus Krumholzibacteria bacterium]
MKLVRAITQAVLLAAVAAAAAFAYNAVQPNGIDPFRRPAEAPVVDRTLDLPGDGSGEPREGISYISLEELREMLEAGDPVIDARTAGEFEGGHIPGAILCDYYEMGTYFRTVLPRLSPEMRIAVYCSGPLCEDSEMLARELYALGYTDLRVFRGGIEEWTAAGMPLEAGYGEDR